MPDLVTVSNGKQFFRIPPDQLAQARITGFYLPSEHSRTIVSDGNEILEIPIADLPSAEKDGFRDALASERQHLSPKASGRPVSTAAVTVQSMLTEKPKRQSESPTAAKPVSEYRRAELEQQARRNSLHEQSTHGNLHRRLFAKAQLWWLKRHAGVLKQIRTNGVSIGLHVALMLILSTVLLVDEQASEPEIITMSHSVDELIEEVVIEQVEIDVQEPIEDVESFEESMEVVSDITEQFVSVDVNDAFDGSMLAAPAKSTGDGDAMEKPSKAKVQFFGSKTEAIHFVFVIDNSNSMTKGRFETALNELLKAVSKLNKRQKFFVIFYSDTAYPLFHPYPPRTLVPATPQNKQLLARWLQTVPLCLRTNGREALDLGFRLNPDVMFVLGDGAFTDGASRYYSSNPNKKVVVHTLGMEVNPKNAASFKQLADAHKGTYQDVGVHPQAALLAQKSPRIKNNSRNGVWGLKLPVVPKKKK